LVLVESGPERQDSEKVSEVREVNFKNRRRLMRDEISMNYWCNSPWEALGSRDAYGNAKDSGRNYNAFRTAFLAAGHLAFIPGYPRRGGVAEVWGR